MIFNTKSIFLWNTPAVERGDPTRIADLLVSAGFQSVAIWTNDGVIIPNWNYAKSPYPGFGENVQPQLIAALKNKGLKVFGWGAVYGKDVQKEAQQAAVQVARFGLDAYIFDAETTFENQAKAVTNTLSLLRDFKRAADCPVGWCSFPLLKNPRTSGRWHNWDIVDAAMTLADAAMPMVYWWGETPLQAEWMLSNSVQQWNLYSHGKPVFPVGRAYNGDDGKAKPDAVAAAAVWVRQVLDGGMSWWSLEHAIRLPDTWKVLAELPGVQVDPPAPPAGVPLEAWAVEMDNWAREKGYSGPRPNLS